MGSLKGKGGANLVQVEEYYAGKIKIEGFGRDHPTKSEYVKVSGREETIAEAVEYLIRIYGKKHQAGGQKGKPV